MPALNIPLLIICRRLFSLFPDRLASCYISTVKNLGDRLHDTDIKHAAGDDSEYFVSLATLFGEVGFSNLGWCTVRITRGLVVL